MCSQGIVFLISDSAALDVVDGWRRIPGPPHDRVLRRHARRFSAPHIRKFPARAAAALLIEQEDGDIDFLGRSRA